MKARNVKIEWVRKNVAGKTDEIRFKSPISIDNGYTNNYQGEYDSTIELFRDEDGVPSGMEWIVGDVEFVEGIGLEFEGKRLTGYDGVFELPAQAIRMLRDLGYTVPAEEFEFD